MCTGQQERVTGGLWDANAGPGDRKAGEPLLLNLEMLLGGGQVPANQREEGAVMWPDTRRTKPEVIQAAAGPLAGY